MKGNIEKDAIEFNLNLRKFLILFMMVMIQFNMLASGEDIQLNQCCKIEKSEVEKFQDIQKRSDQFVIILGAQKSGTTAMFHLLDKHPKTKKAITKLGGKRKQHAHLKELGYWNKPHFWPFQRYLDSFNISALEDGYTFIEGTPEYLLSPGAACRMKKFLPNAKLIVMLKNPAQRAYSNFRMVENRRLCNCKDNWKCKSCGAHLPNFYNLVKQRIDHFNSKNCDLINKPWTSCYGCYVVRMGDFLPRGLYASQLKGWLQYFPPEQILVVSSKDIYNVKKTSKRVFEFSNLEPFEMVEVKGFYGIKHKKMEDVIKGLKLLEEFYEPYNQILYELMDEVFHIKNFSFT